MLCMDAQHTKHVTYKLAYRFLWCPKYRKKILVGKIAGSLDKRFVVSVPRMPEPLEQ